MMAMRPPTARISRPLIAVFILFAAILGVGGTILYVYQRDSVRHQEWLQLNAIASLKANQIASWRHDLVEDGEVLFENPAFARSFKRWLVNPRDTEQRAALMRWMGSMLKPHHQYQASLFFDSEGRLRLSVPEMKGPLNPYQSHLSSEALQNRRVFLSDLHRGEDGKGIHLDLLVPLLVPEEPGNVLVGLLEFGIDPYQALYPLIESWPTPSPSAETMLVRRDRDQVVFLSALRHQGDAAFNLRVPINNRKSLEAVAIRTRRPILEGVDYRGVPVLAAARHVPDSPWYMIAKVDQREIYAPFRTTALVVALGICALLVTAALAVGFIWRGQYLLFQRREQDDLERRVRQRTADLLFAKESLEREIADRNRIEKDLIASEKKLRYLSDQILTAQENERTRISRELHDELGQALATLKLRLGLIDRKLEDRGLKETCGETLRYVDQIIESVRRLSRALSPSVLEYFGLSAAIRRLMDDFVGGDRVDVSMDIADINHLIPKDVHIILYRIFQEALNNIVKHSEATRLSVVMKPDNGSISLFMEDNGKGFDLSKTILGNGSGKGLGLAIMKERVRMLGGILELWSEEGKGTRIHVRVPIPALVEGGLDGNVPYCAGR